MVCLIDRPITEVTITKRILIILTLLVLCVCLPAWAEEIGTEPMPGTISEENAEPSFPDQMADIPGQETDLAFAEDQTAPIQDSAGDDPESLPVSGHTSDHETWEVLRDQSACLSIGSPDVHYVRRTYDLFCGVCQRVVAENYRTEEVNEPHAFAVQSRTMPSCTSNGEETLFCVQCGDTVTNILPIAEHIWEPWDEASATRRCSVCGKVESREAPLPTDETPQTGPEPEPTLPDEPPVQGHTDLHEIRETLHDQPIYRSLGSEAGHLVIRQYDLICLDCQQVIQQAYRTEEMNEPHAFQLISRTAPTCIQQGEEQLHCPVCGENCTNILPLTDHTWGPWTIVAGSEQVLTRICQICGKEETKPYADSPADESTAAPAPEPTEEPTVTPTDEPLDEPTAAPLDDPTAVPSEEPTVSPSEEPTDGPTVPPVQEHTADHQTLEIQVGNPIFQSLGEPDTHHVIRRYDLFCETCQRVVEEEYRLEETTEYHVFSLQSSVAATCTQEGSQTLVCSLCGYQRTDVLPKAEHTWTEWEDLAVSDVPACQREQILTHRCQVCGLEETNVIPAGDHQWQAVSYTEATCTQDGVAVRRCAVCGLEEVISLPALGHTYLQSSNGGTSVCALCGAEKEATQAQSRTSHMYYNNTVTSFGPTTRELIGGSVWNRVTPVDLSEEGVFTFPLVASNQYTVGTATLINGQESQEVKYKLSSPKVNVHSESLVVYPDLEALKTGTHAVSFDFNEPIDLKSIFGKDARVIVAITLKADYDAESNGVSRFWPDQKWIDQMMEMIK